MGANLKLALRVLGRRKVFTAISLIGIALTLLVLVIATAILDDTFAPSGPERRFDRTLMGEAAQPTETASCGVWRLVFPSASGRTASPGRSAQRCRREWRWR